MTNNWQDVWNRRGQGDAAPGDLQRLLEIDGYDTGASRATADNFRVWVRRMADRIGLTDQGSVYEVGCGAGAMLVGLRECVGATVGGCDYAARLVEIARRVLPEAPIEVAEAVDVPIEPVYDVVLSQGAFHYFPDTAYAARALDRMFAKARDVVAVLEVPHAGRRAVAEQTRRAHLPPGQYDRMYAGLDHCYYLPDWFGDVAKAHGWGCEVFDHDLPGYAQNAFRFDVLMRPAPQPGSP